MCKHHVAGLATTPCKAVAWRTDTAAGARPPAPVQNPLGVQRMCRMLASLQPALSGVGTTGTGSFRPEAARAFDRGAVHGTGGGGVVDVLVTDACM